MRNLKNGQYTHKSGIAKLDIIIVAVLIIIIAVAVSLSNKKQGEPTIAEVGTSTFVQEIEAKLSPEVQEYMNSEEFKKEQELIARTRVLTKKRTAEQELTKSNLATVKAEYDAKVLEENKRSKVEVDKIENELTDIRKNELEIGAKSKASLE